MFRKILKKDLQRKKAMNIILFIFMITASILIASSTNLLYSTITAVDYFIEVSDVADLITVTSPEKEITDAIEDWTKNSDMVKDFLPEYGIMLEEKNVSTSTGKELKNANSLVIMQKPEKYNLIFDTEGKDFQVGPSEAAIPVSIQQKMGVEVGERLKLKINGYEKEFIVTYIFKDVVYGSDLLGMKRIILNKVDFNDYSKNAKQEEHLVLWGFEKEQGFQNRELEKQFTNLNLLTFTIFSKDIVSTMYVFDMLMASIMIIVSIFLILISFLILRFTIVFTVMEDYKQIGVMKAIGLKSNNIRRMYSIKYLTLSVIGGLFGYGISIPISSLMKKSISEYLLLKQTTLNGLISIVSVLLVVGVTMLFCNYSTGKIKKISAIDAIRQGNTGERFQNTKKLKLHYRKKMNTPLFLAFSDIVSDFKKFVILMIIFTLGTAIIIIPNNVISTLSSAETIKMFGIIKSDFYIREVLMGNQEEANNLLDEFDQEFEEEGINAILRADLVTTGKVFTLDKKDSIGVLSYQGIRIGSEKYEYLEGSPPKLENEIAITEKIADLFQIDIGDKVLCEVQGQTKEYIVTALFQSFNNLGLSVRLSEGYQSDIGINTTIQLSGNLEGTDKEIKEQIGNLKERFPELDIMDCKEVVNSFIGNITNQITALKNLILIIVLGVNFLITALMLRMFISKEVPEIAILKSLGFSNSAVKRWQIYRIGMILFVSIFVGAILANTTGDFLTSGIFKLMGVTRLQLIIEPLKVYFIYPILLFVITMTGVLCSLAQIKKTHVWELNNQE